ncbi:GTPase, partial [Acinetobacter baumannii]
TSVREIVLPNKQKFLLSDTVGFVTKLPHHLIQAFKSTLAEAADADLLIHVVDYSDPNYLDMMKTTQETLDSLGVKDIPVIEAYNKADLKPDTRYPEVDGTQIVY